MKSFVPSLYKFILGMFLFGLALWANPIEVSAIGTNQNTITYNGNVNNGTSFPSSSFNINDNDPLIQFGLVPYSSFTVNLSSTYTLIAGGNVSFTCNGLYRYAIYVLFSGPDGGAYKKLLCTISDSFLLDNILSQSYNYSFDTFCEGVPTGIRIEPLSPTYNLIYFKNTQYLGSNGGVPIDLTDSPSNIDIALAQRFDISFTNIGLEQSSSGGGSSSTVINNTSSNLIPVGFNSLNFGLNGNCYFFGASRIFLPDYLSPLMFSYDFANSLSGVLTSAPLTFAMGGFSQNDGNVSLASPISVIGDTRSGEYELTISVCSETTPSFASLNEYAKLSNWLFEFNRGYSGDQFNMPSDARVSYTCFVDDKTGYCYISFYFYFTTPDFFDSFLIRRAPAIPDIRVGAFAFNKYTGTISDQLTQSNQQWDYQNPSHSSFSSANSSASSTVSAFSSIEADSFSNLDTAMSGAGVNDFNINVISTPLATVSGMINQVYNILPDLVKWLLLAILVIGFFAVIISSHNYVSNGD